MATSQQTRSPVGRRAKARERKMVPPAEWRSYYGRPVIKEPVWTPEIPIYFFAGGMAGASAGLSLLARITRRKKLARVATANAFIALAVSPPLLISDLGVPKRFLNMLRVFKPSSPMSVGSWLLTLEGGFVALSAADEFLGIVPKWMVWPARVLGAIVGLPVATYTAALVANTSVPIWHEGRRELPFAFAGGSAMAAGGAAALLAPSEAGPARRLAMFGAVTEAVAMEYSKHAMGEIAEPYSTGAAGKFEKATMACAGTGTLLLGYAELRGSRRAGVLGSLFALAGSMFGRWMVYKAGFQSAADPKYTVGPQRERANPPAD